MIVAQPVLAYLRDRLRESLVPKELVNDVDLLRMLSEAYRDACERTRCLQAFTTITFTGAASYPVPDAWFETTGVYTRGSTLPEVPHRLPTLDWPSGDPVQRVHTGRTISFAPLPTAGSAILHYAESPVNFTNIADPLDPRYPQEYAYLLVHHVRWKMQTLAGGAKHIQASAFERNIYDAGIAAMRKTVGVVNRAGPARITLGERPLAS